jgi:hypothetical protein
MAKKKMGRPTECTPEAIEKIAATVEEGLSLADAAALNGLDENTLKLWQKNARQGREPYSSFLTAVTRARANAKRKAVGGVRSGTMMNGKADWKAEAWWLERFYPGEFGPQQVVAVKVEQELEKVVDRLEAVRAKLGEESYNLVCNAILGECLTKADPEE